MTIMDINLNIILILALIRSLFNCFITVTKKKENFKTPKMNSKKMIKLVLIYCIRAFFIPPENIVNEDCLCGRKNNMCANNFAQNPNNINNYNNMPYPNNYMSYPNNNMPYPNNNESLDLDKKMLQINIISRLMKSAVDSYMKSANGCYNSFQPSPVDNQCNNANAGNLNKPFLDSQQNGQKNLFNPMMSNNCSNSPQNMMSNTSFSKSSSQCQPSYNPSQYYSSSAYTQPPNLMGSTGSTSYLESPSRPQWPTTPQIAPSNNNQIDFNSLPSANCNNQHNLQPQGHLPVSSIESYGKMPGTMPQNMGPSQQNQNFKGQGMSQQMPVSGGQRTFIPANPNGGKRKRKQRKVEINCVCTKTVNGLEDCKCEKIGEK